MDVSPSLVSSPSASQSSPSPTPNKRKERDDDAKKWPALKGAKLPDSIYQRLQRVAHDEFQIDSLADLALGLHGDEQRKLVASLVWEGREKVKVLYEATLERFLKATHAHYERTSPQDIERSQRLEVLLKAALDQHVLGKKISSATRNEFFDGDSLKASCFSEGGSRWRCQVSSCSTSLTVQERSPMANVMRHLSTKHALSSPCHSSSPENPTSGSAQGHHDDVAGSQAHQDEVDYDMLDLSAISSSASNSATAPTLPAVVPVQAPAPAPSMASGAGAMQLTVTPTHTVAPGSLEPLRLRTPMLQGLDNVGNSCWMNASLQLLALLGVTRHQNSTSFPLTWMLLENIARESKPLREELIEAVKEVCNHLPDFGVHNDAGCNDAHEFFMAMIADSNFQQRLALELTVVQRCTANQQHVATRTEAHQQVVIAIDACLGPCNLVALLQKDGDWRGDGEYDFL